MRSVFFDVDGVLVHSMFHADPTRRRRWDVHLRADMGIDPEALVPFFATFHRIVEGRVSIVEALDAFLPGTGYRGSSLDFLSYWLHHDSHVDHQLLDVVRGLRASGTRLFIATNQEHVRAFHLWSTVGLRHYFDEMFYAARLGVGKAEPGFYRQVEALIGPQAEPPLFFDDSAKIVAAARDYGWEAVLYSDVADCSRHPWVAARIGSTGE